MAKKRTKRAPVLTSSGAPFPSHSDFLYPYLDILDKLSPITRSKMKEELAKYFKLTSADLKIPTRGGSTTIFESRINWVLQHMRWAGFVDIPKKGTWEINSNGRNYLATHSTISIKDLMAIPSFAAHKK